MPTGTTTHAARSPVQDARRLASSNSIPVGGFTPGTILADRYRIIGLLGRGGMGEVYRADDLKLGYPVALKFLPPALASDPVKRERFFAEVRITRQLSHPNICRVYDIAEFEGRHFLTMEYIDGEDLASLIKRIGYLSNEKALDIARQLAAGLRVAHEHGVLHRDLKPANIMIDGHGRVRITDFGIAIVGGDETSQTEIAGTPTYMAPEQFAGKGASVRSDIYALGLILYELYCGKRVFTADTIPELREQKLSLTPTAPSEIRDGFDPVVERVILRCLERDPRARPASVAQLAAALPGGDPLAAAIAAGETPLPEMVAASGLKEGLRPAFAVALLAATILVLIGIVLSNPRSMTFERVHPAKSPDVLVERAQEIIRKAGYTDPPADTAYGFRFNMDAISYLQEHDKTPSRWENLGAYQGVYFWYRQSPRPLEHWIEDPVAPDTVTLEDPPATFSGEVEVILDVQGRLRTLSTIPPQIVSSTIPSSSPDWTNLFASAGINTGALTSAEPQWNPDYYADQHDAWKQEVADATGIPVHIEAASYRGKPVEFDVITPWARPLRMSPYAPGTGVTVEYAILVVLLIAAISGGVFFARRNLRLGRGDRRGATRLAVFVFSALLLGWIVGEHHVSTFSEVTLFLTTLGGTLLWASLVWLLYVALEPFVRRRWPQILVSWTRVLAGDWSDPLVGRDVLTGCLAGSVGTLLLNFSVIAPSWFGRPDATPLNGTLLSGTGSVLRYLLGIAPVAGIFLSLGFFFIFFLLRLLVRTEWVAAVIWLAILVPAGPLDYVGNTWWIIAIFNLLWNAILLALLIRIGLTAAVVALMVLWFLHIPITFQTSAWYFGPGAAALFLCTALTVYGFRTSLGGRHLIGISEIGE
jgi:serine/threonine-protein kinase